MFEYIKMAVVRDNELGVGSNGTVVSAATGNALQKAVGIDYKSCHRLFRVKIHFADFV